MPGQKLNILNKKGLRAFFVSGASSPHPAAKKNLQLIADYRQGSTFYLSDRVRFKRVMLMISLASSCNQGV